MAPTDELTPIVEELGSLNGYGRRRGRVENCSDSVTFVVACVV